MITEDYVSYKVAKILKEKGFDIECTNAYYNGILTDYTMYGFCIDGEFIFAPTHQMVMKWLREVYGKHCYIGYDIDLEWYFQIVDLKETVEYDHHEAKYYHSENETNFKTYEEAVEAALKYSLINLI